MPLTTATCLNEQFYLQECLGNHGARQTWLAWDVLTEKKVTVKTLYFGQVSNWQELTLFEREIATLKHLNHPRLPRYQQSVWLEQIEGNYLCLIQDYIAGQALADLAGKRCTEAEVKTIAEELLVILVYLHSYQPAIIHRDLKPSNVIIGEDKHIYLIDFGSVQAANNPNSTMTVVGTYGYMPPEQFGGRTVPASDLYSLGATLLFLLTGRHPADLPQINLQIQFKDRVNVSPAFETWLTHMVEPALDRRYQTAALALTELLKPSLTTHIPIPNSLITLSKTAEQLDITLPALGVRQKNLGSVVEVSLISLILLIYTVVLARIPSLEELVAIAWLGAGIFGVFKLWSIFGTTQLHFERDQFTIFWEMAGFRYTYRGKTRRLRKSKIKKFTTLNNKQIEYCTLQQQFLSVPFGLGLTHEEQTYLVTEIATWLKLP